MTEKLCRQLREWAEAYHQADFIANDPVQFPHRYVRQEDIEIMGLLTAVLSFGNRRMILRKVDELDGLMGRAPLQYVLSRRWENRFQSWEPTELLPDGFVCGIPPLFISRSCMRCIRRIVRWRTALLTFPGNPMQKLCAFLGPVQIKVRRRSSTCFCAGLSAAGKGRTLACHRNSWDANDVLVPSAESVLRNILYGQNYYRTAFGTESTDIFLPDCFGFGVDTAVAGPSLWADRLFFTKARLARSSFLWRQKISFYHRTVEGY